MRNNFSISGGYSAEYEGQPRDDLITYRPCSIGMTCMVKISFMSAW